MSNEYNGKKRSELPDSVFGIPQERKYPMPDEKHTRSAIKLFNHVDPKYEEQLAKAVIKNMKKYGIDGSVVGPNNRLRKYLPKDMIKESAARPLIYTWERTNIPEYPFIQESSHKSDFSYTGIKTSAEKSEFKRDFREVFKEDPTESSINYMQMIKYKGSLVGYIGFSRYKEGKKKYLGIGNFMILKKYQRGGMGSKVIYDIIDRYKDNYDEIYCYVDKDNTNAIAFYKKIAKVNTDNLTRYGYYVTLYKKGSTNESCLLQEVSIPEEIPNDIRELLRRLNSYDYGYIKNGQKIKGMKNFFENYKSLTISEFEKYQIGVCWDYVHYEAYWFAKNHYKYETFYIQVQDEDNDCPSHTYLVFYLPNSSKVYYFESSWGKYQGIEAFDNINKLHNTIKERHIESARSKCDPKTYFRNKYDAKSSRWEHLSCGDFMVKVSNGKVQVNESVSILPQDTGITTVIFDIGDVLVSANIKDYLVADPEVPNEIVDELLKLWFIDKDEVDDTMDLDTYREIVNKRMGTEFSKYIPKLFRYNVECVTAFDYTIPMIQDLKDKGYKVYYLSNWSAWTHDLLQEAGKFDFLKLMDGGVFSYDVGYMKPNEEIYKILLNKYKINPEEAVFFDDREENIEAANKMGINGILFDKHDPSIVYNALEKFSVLYEQAIQSINEVSKNRRYYNYNVLEDAYLSYMNEISLWVKVDEDKVAKEILNIIRPIIISQDNKSKASKMRLSLKCEVEEVDSGIVIILVLDGTQDKRDTNDARIMLKELASKCKPKLSKLVSKIDIGDGDEGCLYFTMDKGKIKKNRKDLIKESTNEEIVKSEINDIKEIISILNDDDFKNFKFTNIAYCDIRYRNSKPIAFITIRTKPINNYIVGFVSLAVIPKYQNQGIGRSLTEKAIKWFKKNKGIDFLEWHCLPNNAASNKLANDACFSKYIAKDDGEYNTYTMESVIETNISEYGTTGGTIVGANQPDSVYIVNYMQNNVFSGYKEPKQAICKKGMNQMYTTKNGKAVPVDKDKFKEEASDVSVFRFKETPVLSFDKIIENASVDEDFFLLLTGDFPEDRVGKLIEYDNRFVQEENFFDELDDITYCTESTIIGQIEATDYPYMKILTESMEGRCWNYYRDINGVFAMNELTGLRTPSYEDITDIPNSQIQLIERGTVYFGD